MRKFSTTLLVLSLALVSCAKEQVEETARQVGEKLGAGLEKLTERSKELMAMSREELVREFGVANEKLEKRVADLRAKGGKLSDRGRVAFDDMQQRLKELSDEHLDGAKLAEARKKLVEAWRALEEALLK